MPSVLPLLALVVCLLRTSTWRGYAQLLWCGSTCRRHHGKRDRSPHEGCVHSHPVAIYRVSYPVYRALRTPAALRIHVHVHTSCTACMCMQCSCLLLFVCLPAAVDAQLCIYVCMRTAGGCSMCTPPANTSRWCPADRCGVWAKPLPHGVRERKAFGLPRGVLCTPRRLRCHATLTTWR